MPNCPLSPLRFKPQFRQYIWGGRRLHSLLGKPIGTGENYAESWEIVDHGDDQSCVAFGQLAGQTLHQIVADYGTELFGKHHPQKQFPLLFKFLDANRDLSVQVHPNDQQGALLSPPDLGKTEAWVILHAEPGAKVYAGLNDSVTKENFAVAIRDGMTESCLHSFEPEIGDCIFIPAGTVHALGAGLVVAEIQQASDTTFRIFDWNRIDDLGVSRPLHIEQAMDVINFNAGPTLPQRTCPTDSNSVLRLVDCEKFVLERMEFSSPICISTDDRFQILAVVEGSLEVANDPALTPLSLGQTMLVPACCDSIDIQPHSAVTILKMFLP